MFKRAPYVLMVLSILMTVMYLSGCGTTLPTGNDPNTNTGTDPNTNTGKDPNTNTGTDPNTNTSLTIVKTSIPMHVQAKILAGDDLVVYGTGQVNANKGVAYIVPSAGNTQGQAITNAEDWCAYSFAVAGKKIGLVKDDFSVAVYDTTTQTLSPISKNVIYLNGIEIGAYKAGNIQGDGNYFAVSCDTGNVTDGKGLKVIDVTGSTPQVITFTKEILGNAILQYAIDGTAKKVAAATSDAFYIFDITAPTADPVKVDNTYSISMKVQMSFRDGKILFIDGGYEKLHLADAATKQITEMSVDPNQWDFPTTIDIDMNNGKLGYFMVYYPDGASFRGAVGNVASAPSVSTPPVSENAVKIDGATDNNGHLGYASTISITPDGSKIFIAGNESIGQGEYLQYSTGGVNFALIQCTGGDTYGFPASDVSASNNTVAFKGGTNESTYVCYIKLK
jgi:hypothetical protein